MSLPTHVRSSAAAWLARWAPILPLLFAEFVLWTGFGALLPIMPLYLRDHGVEIALLGVVIAAWPATRLIAEPIFGYLADRWTRVPLMVAGLLVAAVATGLMVVLDGIVAFIVLRAMSGLGTAMYDPAARGYLTDATAPDRRGEVFGLYNASQMGGILLGPAIGGVGAAWFGGFAFTIAFGAVAIGLAALAVWSRVRERPRSGAADRLDHPAIPVEGLSDFPIETMGVERASRRASPGSAVPIRLANRFLATALVGTFAGYLASGLYETVWSLFLESRGGSLELIGLTFAVFGFTTIVVSPLGGRAVDRVGPRPFVVAGLLVMTIAMVAYPLLPDVRLSVLVIVLEALGFSFFAPAMFAIVAAGAPSDRSSTAQGIVGAAGTLGTIVASLATAVLASIHIDLPFFAGAITTVVLLALTMFIGWRPMGALRPG